MLKGKEKTLRSDYILILDTVHTLGILYKSKDKLAEAEAIYNRALQGYKKAFGLKLALSYLPALNIMFVIGDLFPQTDRKDIARAMYN